MVRQKQNPTENWGRGVSQAASHLLGETVATTDCNYCHHGHRLAQAQAQAQAQAGHIAHF